MMMRNLGRGYVVWDKAAEIEFVSPGRTAVTAQFDLDPAVVAEVRAAADAGEKVLRWFEVDVVGTDGCRRRSGAQAAVRAPGAGRS